MEERATEDASPALRQSRAWAFVGWLLLATSMWMSWWRIRFLDLAGNRVDEAHVYPLRDHAPFAGDMVWVTVGLVAVALLILFVRLAGRSWLYEPPAWRTSLWIAMGLSIAAVASAFGWPRGESVAPTFWGGVDFVANGTGEAFTVTAGPALGWWVCMVAAACISIAAVRATTSK